MTSTTPIARLGRATLGNSAWYLDQLITFLAIGEDTEGRFALLRVQGDGLPTHVHTLEDETIYVIHGELMISAGRLRLYACPGDIVTIPRGVEHTVRHDTSDVLFLLQYSPAGFERYFHEMSEPAEFLGLPPHPVPVDHARMVATAAHYGCVFTGLNPCSVRQDH